jgi:hypothetical protein
VVGWPVDTNGFGCTLAAEPVETNTVNARTRAAASANVLPADFFIFVLPSGSTNRTPPPSVTALKDR